jgi:hypothetical protein
MEMITVKELPARAVPFVIYLMACGVFGELYLRMPSVPKFPETQVAWIMGIFMIASGVLFFTKCFFGKPTMKGLDLD